MANVKLYSNEIVFRGHPDKVCDQISGALVDAYLKGDPLSRCGIEVMGGKGKIFITGEVSSKAKVNVKKVVKRVLRDVGYSTKYNIIVNLSKQSPDIALGVDREGAGDQGMMFGYACNDTKELLPTAMVILQKFAQRYDEIRQESPRIFYPDGKAQITGYYNKDFKLTKIKDFVISYQNCETMREQSDERLKLEAKLICQRYNIEIENFHINPTGKFLIGGFEGDAGLTGRKIVVDAYQSFANVGGGTLNGKDPTKVDLSAAYKARKIAKKYLKDYNLKWCEVQISYAIGQREPLAIYITSDLSTFRDIDYKLYKECEPARIIKDLKLRSISYEKAAQFGHFRG